jgi:hypothetical protein
MFNTHFTIYTLFCYSLSRCMCVTWSWRTCILGFALKSGCETQRDQNFVVYKFPFEIFNIPKYPFKYNEIVWKPISLIKFHEAIWEMYKICENFTTTILDDRMTKIKAVHLQKSKNFVVEPFSFWITFVKVKYVWSIEIWIFVFSKRPQI